MFDFEIVIEMTELLSHYTLYKDYISMMEHQIEVIS